MPAKSKAQSNLMRAALHGATFPKAREIRQSMTPTQIRDYATTDTSHKPQHVSHPHANLGTYLHPKKAR